VDDLTVIDVIVTNSSEDVDFFTQIDLPSCKTMHDLIYGSMRFPDVSSRSEDPFYFGYYYLAHVPRLIRDVDVKTLRKNLDFLGVREFLSEYPEFIFFFG
jgi:hypothetical protein